MKPFDFKVQRSYTYSNLKFEDVKSFVHIFYQLRDVFSFSSRKRILVIGPGLGFEVVILKHLGFEVITLDINLEVKPDFIGSVDNMKCFSNKEFDIVICSHVLEHLPFEYFENSLQEIQRITKYALIYLPIAGLNFSFRISLPKINDKYINFYLPVFIFKTHKFDGEHYWEINTHGYSKKKIREIIKKYFSIIKEYHNPEWRYSYNFVLSSKK